MSKKTAIILSILFLLVTDAASCKNQEEHYILKVYNKMVKGELPEEVAKSYTIDSLNFVQLDSLGLTTDYINTWAKLYIDKGITADLVKDSRTLIDRLGEGSLEDIKTFIKTIAKSNVLTTYPNVAASIVAYPYGIDVSADEYSEIATRLLVSTALSGNLAPQIEGLQPLDGVSSTIVLFYDGNCGNCKQLLDELTNNYDRLTAKGVRIVTISASQSKEVFEHNLEKYPWTDKLCDYKSFNGVNFKRFGIASTPIMFVIDKDGVVVDQFGNLAETGLIN